MPAGEKSGYKQTASEKERLKNYYEERAKRREEYFKRLHEKKPTPSPKPSKSTKKVYMVNKKTGEKEEVTVHYGGYVSHTADKPVQKPSQVGYAVIRVGEGKDAIDVRINQRPGETPEQFKKRVDIVAKTGRVISSTIIEKQQKAQRKTSGGRKFMPYERAAGLDQASYEKPEVLIEAQKKRVEREYFKQIGRPERYESIVQKQQRLKEYEGMIAMSPAVATRYGLASGVLMSTLTRSSKKEVPHSPVGYAPAPEVSEFSPAYYAIKSEKYRIKAIQEKSKVRQIGYTIASKYYNVGAAFTRSESSFRQAVKERGAFNFALGAALGVATTFLPQPASKMLTAVGVASATLFTPGSIVKQAYKYQEEGYDPFSSFVMSFSSGGADVATSIAGYGAGRFAATSVRVASSYIGTRISDILATRKVKGLPVSAASKEVALGRKVYVTEVKGVTRITFGFQKKGATVGVQVDVPKLGKTYIIEELPGEKPIFKATLKAKGIAGVLPESQRPGFSKGLPSYPGKIVQYTRTQTGLTEPSPTLMQKKFSVFVGESAGKPLQRAFIFEKGRITFEPWKSSVDAGFGAKPRATSAGFVRVGYQQKALVGYTPKLEGRPTPKALPGWVKEAEYMFGNRVGFLVRDVQTGELSEYVFKNPLVVSKIRTPFKFTAPKLTPKVAVGAGFASLPSSTGAVSAVILERPKVMTKPKAKAKTKPISKAKPETKFYQPQKQDFAIVAKQDFAIPVQKASFQSSIYAQQEKLSQQLEQSTKVKSGIKSRSRAKLEQEYILKQMQKQMEEVLQQQKQLPNQKQLLKQSTLRKQIQSPISQQIINIQQVQIPITKEIQIQKVDEINIQKPDFSIPSPPIDIDIPVPIPDIKPPKAPPIPHLPNFGGVGDFDFSIPIKTKEKRKYSPDVTSYLFGIFAPKKPRKKKFTGFEVRPLPWKI